VSIRDEGKGFDPDGAADPRDSRNIEKTSGRGLFLMRNFVDQIEFRHVPGEGMLVRLIKHLPGRDGRSAGVTG